MKTGGKKLSGIKLVIFDLDGTLVDAYRAIETALNYTRSRFEFANVSYHKIKTSVGKGDKSFIECYFPPELADRALKIYREKHKQTLSQGVKLLPYSKSTLAYLKRKGYSTAIASNRPAVFTELILHNCSLDRFIDYTLCADKIGRLKPSPEILFNVMKKFKYSPSASVYVGDMVIDIETAKNAGIRCIAVRTGSDSMQELNSKKPFLILENLKYFKDLF